MVQTIVGIGDKEEFEREYQAWKKELFLDVGVDDVTEQILRAVFILHEQIKDIRYMLEKIEWCL